MENNFIPFWMLAPISKSGSVFYFPIPQFAIKNHYISPNLTYNIKFAKKSAIDIDNVSKKQIQNLFSFNSKPAKSGNSYRFTIPSFLIKSKYISTNLEYWLFISKI